MKRFLVLLSICLAFAPTLGAQEPFDEALRLAGLSTETARLDADALRMATNDEFVLPSFQVYHSNPFRIPVFAATLRNGLTVASSAPAALISQISRHLGSGTARALLGNPITGLGEKAAAPGAFSAAVKAIASASGAAEFSAADQVKLDEAEKSIPAPVLKAAALILLQAIESRHWRDRAFADIENASQLHTHLVSTASTDATDAALYEMKVRRRVDYRALYAGAFDASLAVQQAIDTLAVSQAPGDFKFEMDTAWGVVALNGPDDNVYSQKPYLLIIDTGGNDTYHGGAANSTAACSFSALIDTSGNDKYVESKALASTVTASYAERKNRSRTPLFAGALMGYAFLVDAAGDDLYRCVAPGVGAARYGVGILWDKSGADQYDTYTESQGSAYDGIAVLLDDGGADSYLTFANSQGYGGTYGFGLLLDKTGSDLYIANNSVLDFPSAQSKDHNTSLSQGCGIGRRADYLDGHSFGGGIGVLMDVAGDDQYRCGVFGQGAGYWEGIGALFDLAGSDSYSGTWYVQGSAAHYAVGILQDIAGSDSYASRINMSAGAGHDYSIGVLEDFAGNDTYVANTLSLGAANANGIGIFFDAAGNDTYQAPSITLGWSTDPGTGTLREKALSLGVFIDIGGTDTYPEAVKHAKNAARSVQTTRKNERANESQVGVFLDR